MTLLLYKSFVYILFPEPAPDNELTFSKKRSCWDTPKSGTIPIVEFDPVIKPFIAFAVEDKVPSS